MGSNGRDAFADYEEDGGRYDSVIPPDRPRSGEFAGERAEANSPQVGGRSPVCEENDDPLRRFFAATVESDVEQEARDMLREFRDDAVAIDELAESAIHEVSSVPPQHAIEELYRQVRTIQEMAGRIEAELKRLLQVEPSRVCEAHQNGRTIPQVADNTRDANTSSEGEYPSWCASHTLQENPVATDLAAPVRTESQATKRTRGPGKLTPARRDEIIHYIRAGLSMRHAAAYVGCHHTTITKAAQRDPEFAWKLQQAELMGEALPLVRLIRASRQSWRAAAWLAKNHQGSARLRREKAAERDAEAAESILRIDRLIREQAGDVEVKTVLRGESFSVELRPRSGGSRQGNARRHAPEHGI